MEALPKILDKAEELFFNYGVKSITMDDMAQNLGISKKTLYQHVSNKADLVNKTLVSHLEEEKKSITEICANSENAVEELFEIAKHVTEHLRGINPSVVYDLQKYYPKTWRVFLNYKSSFLYSTILNNLKKGINQGYYRQDVNPDIIAKIYNARSEFLVDQDIFPYHQYSILDVYTEFFKYHIRGIASEKGLKYLEKLKLN